MKSDFVLAFNEVLEEKQLPKEVVLQALEAAMVSAYRRAVNASNAQMVEAKIDPETGKVVIFAEKEVVDNVQDERTEVSIHDAQKIVPEADLGEMVVVESTPRDFGRVAAQTARQVIQQRIREAERESQMNFYSKQVGEIINGIVQAVTPQTVTLGLDMKAEGVLPRNQQVPGERFRVHDRVQALLLEVKQTPRGPQIVLSRAHRNFLRRLLENEVPEIYHGLVEIRSIAREPGQRSKVAVAALQPAVDPVGACVGIRGVRIQAIVRELNDEKIDVIEWSSDPSVYIAKALSPARVTGVYLNEHAKGTKTATVVVPEDQLSLAIGRDGQNARLAAKLTSWRIDIKSLPEAASDALYKLQKDEAYAFMLDDETAVIPQVEAIMAKKAEGRPVTPEEYNVLSHFVDRIERGMINQRSAEKRAEEERIKELRSRIPEVAFETSLDEIGISNRVFDLLSEANFQTIGDVMLQMEMDSDEILKINGMGPKAMEELEQALGAYTFPVEEEPELELTEALQEELAAQPEVAAEAVLETGVEEPAGEPVTGEIEQEQVGEAVLETAPETAPETALETAPEGVVEPESVAEISEEVLEGQPAAEMAVEAEAVSQEEASEEEEKSSLEEIFALAPEDLGIQPDTDLYEEEEEEEEEFGQKKGKKGKKKKQRKFVEVEYDPDRDVVVVKRKRKRGGDDWDGWDY